MNHVAPVGRQLTNLFAADEGADFAGLSLHLQSLRLNGHALFRTADCQAHVDSQGLGDVQYDAGARERLETACRRGERVGSDAKVSEPEETGFVGF